MPESVDSLALDRDGALEEGAERVGVTLVDAPGRQGAPLSAPFDPPRSMTELLAVVKSMHRAS